MKRIKVESKIKVLKSLQLKLRFIYFGLVLSATFLVVITLTTYFNYLNVSSIIEHRHEHHLKHHGVLIQFDIPYISLPNFFYI